MKAVLLVSHGSRFPKAIEEVSALVGILRQHYPSAIVDFAFLDVQAPDIPEGIDRCVSKGAVQIVLALNFLNAGRHVDEDIPAIVFAAKEKYPHVEFVITKPVGQHPQIANLFIDLINNA